MLTKHNVYSAKVMLFPDSGKVFINFFSSDYGFSSFCGVQDRFSWENLDRSPTLYIIYMLFLDNTATPSGFPSQTYFQYSTLSLLLSTPQRI